MIAGCIAPFTSHEVTKGGNRGNLMWKEGCNPSETGAGAPQCQRKVGRGRSRRKPVQTSSRLPTIILEDGLGEAVEKLTIILSCLSKRKPLENGGSWKKGGQPSPNKRVKCRGRKSKKKHRNMFFSNLRNKSGRTKHKPHKKGKTHGILSRSGISKNERLEKIWTLWSVVRRGGKLQRGRSAEWKQELWHGSAFFLRTPDTAGIGGRKGGNLQQDCSPFIRCGSKDIVRRRKTVRSAATHPHALVGENKQKSAPIGKPDPLFQPERRERDAVRRSWGGGGSGGICRGRLGKSSERGGGGKNAPRRGGDAKKERNSN